MILLMAGVSLVVGIIYALLVSIKLRGTKSLFATISLLPMVVAFAICITGAFLSGAEAIPARIVTIAVALGLIRFRSAPSRAEELVILFGGVAIGLISGLGYVAISAILALLVSVLYVILSHINIFKFKRIGEEKLLKITIPEELNYNEAFDAILKTYLKSYELVEIKTASMGSLFRLSYKVELLTKDSEKALIDELRIKNSNLDISLLPYLDDNKAL